MPFFHSALVVVLRFKAVLSILGFHLNRSQRHGFDFSWENSILKSQYPNYLLRSNFELSKSQREGSKLLLEKSALVLFAFLTDNMFAVNRAKFNPTTPCVMSSIKPPPYCDTTAYYFVSGIISVA